MRDVGLAVLVQADEVWNALCVVDVSLVFRVAVGDERRWVVDVGVVGNCTVVLCDGTWYIELLWVEVAGIRRGWGWCILACIVGECIGDSGNTLYTDVVFHLVVSVGVATRIWRLSWAGGCGEVGVVAAVIRGGVLHLSGGSGQEW